MRARTAPILPVIWFVCTSWSFANPEDPMQRALAQLENAVQGVSGWLARCYDPKTGGFFECPELKSLPGAWGPDIQSTTQVLAIVFEGERITLLPPTAKLRLTHYFASRQEPSGWFIDPHYPQMRDLPRIRARSLGFGLGSLKQLGAEPSFPVPGSDSRAPASHLENEESVASWVDALDWSNPWTALDRLSAEGPVFAALPPSRRELMIDAAIAAVRRHANAQTGLYGTGSLEVQISGAAKFGWFCQKVGRAFPTPEASEKAVLDWVRSNPDVDRATIVRNAVQHLDDLQSWLPRPTPANARAQVIAWAASAITRFAVGDAFAMEGETPRGLIQPNDLRGLGHYPGPVASINGTAQVLRVRGKAYSLAGVHEPPLPGVEELIAALIAPVPVN